MLHIWENEILKRSAVGQRVTHAFIWRNVVYFIFDNGEGVSITGIGHSAIPGSLSESTVRKIFANIEKEGRGILAILGEDRP